MPSRNGIAGQPGCRYTWIARGMLEPSHMQHEEAGRKGMSMCQHIGCASDRPVASPACDLPGHLACGGHMSKRFIVLHQALECVDAGHAPIHNQHHMISVTHRR
jgi:hypothetical protein